MGLLSRVTGLVNRRFSSASCAFFGTVATSWNSPFLLRKPRKQGLSLCSHRGVIVGWRARNRREPVHLVRHFPALSADDLKAIADGPEEVLTGRSRVGRVRGASAQCSSGRAVSPAAVGERPAALAFGPQRPEDGVERVGSRGCAAPPDRYWLRLRRCRRSPSGSTATATRWSWAPRSTRAESTR